MAVFFVEVEAKLVAGERSTTTFATALVSSATGDSAREKVLSDRRGIERALRLVAGETLADFKVTYIHQAPHESILTMRERRKHPEECCATSASRGPEQTP